jgi:lycopene cyclase domain-containing protein
MEKYLYLFLDLATLSVPLMASFYPKHSYFKHWSSLFKAILIVAIPFLIWDMFFTSIGVWGFNPTYLTGISIGNLPIEEVLFFILIPYSSVFVYFSLEYLLKTNPLDKFQKKITFLLLAVLGVILIFNFTKWYTATTFSFVILYLLYHLKKKTNLGLHYLSYSVTLIFFLLVNGTLTGTFIEEPVVWYNNSENLGYRIGTIPFEDVFYGFLLVAGVIDWFNYFRAKNN